MSRRPFALIAGGGTAGHVLLGVAVGRALVARGHQPLEVELVGSRRGQEPVLLADVEFSFHLLRGRGIVRHLRPTDLVANLQAAAGLTWSAIEMAGRMVLRRPAVVVTVGGYASLSTGLAAILLRVPVVNVNVDAVPGAVSSLLGRFATVNAVAFPATPLPRSVVTGTPLRHELMSVDRSQEAVGKARAILGLPEEAQTVAIFGGSLGARRLNEAAIGLAERWRDRKNLTLYHVTGRRNWEAVSSAVGSKSSLGASGFSYRCVPFEDRMALLYAAADIVICRAGALTVAELALAGVPAVLVPLPGAPGDHQSANARTLVEAQAAILVKDSECDADRLGPLLEELLGDPHRLVGMSLAARSLGRPDAADRVAELVDDSAR